MKLTAVLILLCVTSGVAQIGSDHNILSAKITVRNSADEIPLQRENKDLFSPPVEKKSAGLAILYSFLLPGMGEIYAGDYSLGKYFTIADASLWGALAGMNYYGAWQRDNYKAFAKTHAGVNPDGKDEEYFATIGGFLNIDRYNREHELYREYDKLYDANTHSWRWNSNSDRREYRTMWLSSESAFNNIRFVAGALILNRVISVINAVRLVSRYNKNLSAETAWNISAGLSRLPDNSSQLQLNFFRTF